MDTAVDDDIAGGNLMYSNTDQSYITETDVKKIISFLLVNKQVRVHARKETKLTMTTFRRTFLNVWLSSLSGSILQFMYQDLEVKEISDGLELPSE